MHIIIASATKAEIAPLLTLPEGGSAIYNMHRITPLVTGVGQAAATWALTDALHREKPDLVIQAGIGGVFGDAALPGEVVYVSSDVFGDLGIEEKAVFTPLAATPLLATDDEVYTGAILPNDWLSFFPGGYKAIKGVTVNKVTDNPAQAAQLVATFNPGVESMEGAALHYVCRRHHIPFLQLRAISNKVGERDKSKWVIAEAVTRLNEALAALLPQLRDELFDAPATAAAVAGAPLTLCFSPCPNDTFIFDALVHHKIDTQGLSFEVLLEDVETLNQRAIAGTPDITKLSYGVLPLVLDRYRVLNSGSALGRGAGPLLVTTAGNAARFAALPDFSVALPGEHTTANLLFSLAYPGVTQKTFLRYDEIEAVVLENKVSAGVLIHENRFTYADKGLERIADLGDFWEKTSGQPIPLGGIVIRRNLPLSLQQTVDKLIRQSVEYAFAHYPELTDYIRMHAREMSEDVMRKHIDLYVNSFSINLGSEGRQAILRLLNGIGKEEDIFV